MTEVIIILAVTLAVIIAAGIFFKNDDIKTAPFVIIAAVAATLIAGMGIRVREMAEGPFTYIDQLMAVFTGALFVMLLADNGTFDYMLGKIGGKARSPLASSYLLLLLVALPGMLTGTATMAVVTTGVLVGGVLIKKGVDKVKAVEFVGVGAVLGMLLPPLCLPAMITATSRGGSFPGTFVGFALLLLVLGVPAFLVYGFLASKRVFGDVSKGALISEAPAGKPICLIPLIVVLLLTIANDFLAGIVPFLGYPLIFTIGFILAIFLPASKTNPLKSALNGVSAAAAPLAIAVAAGIMLEIYTLTGVSGTLTLTFIENNPAMLLITMVLVIILAGVFFGTSLAAVLTSLCACILGTVFYSTTAQEAVPLTAIAVGLVLAVLLALRGGVMSKAASALGCGEIPLNKAIAGAAVPAAIVLVLCAVLAIGGKSLAFLIL